MRYLLDTNIVSSPIAREPNAAVVSQLRAKGHECAIPAPVWHELTFGCHRLARGKRRDALHAYLQDVVLASFPVLPYDESSAQWHGLERARLEGLGKPTPFVDGQIAAIAYVNDMTLVTANTKDFARFRQLKVENWSTRRG